MAQSILFYLFSFIAIGSALAVIFVQKPTRALLSLLLSMAALAVLFTLLEAYFVAIVHIIVYAGAVLVLFLFVIMLQGLGASTPKLSERFPRSHTRLIIALGVVLFIVFLFCIALTSFQPMVHFAGTAKAIGAVLFTEYLIPFELISILLLLGIFASISLAKEDSKEPKS